MKRFSPLLLVFPALGVLLLAGLWRYFGATLRLAADGEIVPARIAAVLKTRETDADLIHGLDHELVLTDSSGRVWRASLRDHALLTLVPEPAPGAYAPAPELLTGLARADLAGMRRLLQREAGSSAPVRVLRVVKTETARGWFGVPRYIADEVFAHLALDSDGRVVPAHADAVPGVLRTRAELRYDDPVLLEKQKGDGLVDYERLAHDSGEAAPVPARRDFVLYDEPYATVQRPVFVFTPADGSPRALISDLGRHGNPPMSFALFGAARALHRAADPDRALLLAEPGDPRAASAKLAWFSQACEGLFARWGYVVVLAFFGALFGFVGLVLVSLALVPARQRIAPDHA